MQISVIRDTSVEYPSAKCRFSPSLRYPEYGLSALAEETNSVYDMVRTTLRQAHVGSPNQDKAMSNPLRRWIAPGQRVFVLPNLVSHGLPSMTTMEHFARLTHGSVLRAVVDYCLLANEAPERVRFGNAPLQSCDYAAASRISGVSAVSEFYRETLGVDLGPRDLRSVRTSWNRFGALLARSPIPDADPVAVDLKSGSSLDPLFTREGTSRIRVGDYQPALTLSYHAPGRHVYMISKAVLEADVIVILPKLKTHQKVGMTGALKGCVGAVTHKDCLAHHRLGSSRDGGDEYPGNSRVRGLLSEWRDFAERRGSGVLSNMNRVAVKAASKALELGSKVPMGGAWHGNDTAWRMALDLSRILRYAHSDGMMSAVPVRQLLCLVDGIVAGEGDGPLRPRARRTGMMIFGPDAAWTDYVSAVLAGLNPAQMSLIHNALKAHLYPMSDIAAEEVTVAVNGKVLALDALRPLDRLEPPKGWVGHIENAMLGAACAHSSPTAGASRLSNNAQESCNRSFI